MWRLRRCLALYILGEFVLFISIILLGTGNNLSRRKKVLFCFRDQVEFLLAENKQSKKAMGLYSWGTTICVYTTGYAFSFIIDLYLLNLSLRKQRMMNI